MPPSMIPIGSEDSGRMCVIERCEHPAVYHLAPNKDQVEDDRYFCELHGVEFAALEGSN